MLLIELDFFFGAVGDETVEEFVGYGVVFLKVGGCRVFAQQSLAVLVYIVDYGAVDDTFGDEVALVCRVIACVGGDKYVRDNAATAVDGTMVT